MLPYPDVEQFVLDLLEDIAPTLTATGYDSDPPLFVVERVGGAPDVDDVTDYPLVQVAALGATRPDAWDLAHQAQVKLLSAPGTDVNDVFCDSCDIAVGNQQVPDLDPDDRRVIAVYRLGFRRQVRFN